MKASLSGPALLLALTCFALPAFAQQPEFDLEAFRSRCREIKAMPPQEGYEAIQVYAAELVKAHASTVPALEAALKSGDDEIKALSAMFLGYMGPESKPAIPSLREALKDECSGVRVQSIYALEHLSDPEKPDPLIPLTLLEALQDPVREVRRAASFALTVVAVPDPRVLGALVYLLKDTDLDIAGNAAKALGGLGWQASSALPELLTAMVEGNPMVSMEAKSAVSQIDPEYLQTQSIVTSWLSGSREEEVVKACKLVRGLAPFLPEVLPALRKLLLGSNPEIILWALSALERTGPGSIQALPELTASLDSTNPSIVRSALSVLVGLGPEASASMSKIVPLLKDSDPKTRSWAAMAAAEVYAGDKDHLPRIAEALEDSETRVRYWALIALGRAGEDSFQFVEKIKKFLDSDASSERRAALYALGGMGAKGSDFAPVFLAFLDDPEPSLVAEAILALGRIGAKECLPRLLEFTRAKNRDLRAAAKKSLQSLGHEPSIDDLLAELDDPDPFRIAETLASLARRGAKAAPALPLLIPLIDHESELVSRRAVLVISQIGEKAGPAVPALLKALQRENSLQEDVLCALGQIGAEAAVAIDQILEALSSPKAGTRSAAAGALANIGKPARKAVPALIQRLSDEDDEVRSAACRALQNMGDLPESAVPVLLERLDEKGIEKQSLRSSALRCLGRCGRSGLAALPKMIEALEASEGEAQSAAAALGDLGDGSKPVLEALEEATKGGTFLLIESTRSLHRLGGNTQEGVDRIVVFLEKFHSKEIDTTEINVLPACYYALWVLGELRGDAGKAIPILQKYLSHENEALRKRAREALEKIGG